MKHGSFWSVSLLFASYCIWQVEISYPISLPSIPIDLYLSEVSVCLLSPLFLGSKHNHQRRVLFQYQCLLRIINVQRKQQGTKDSALWDTRQNRSPIRFCSVYNNSLLSIAQKRIYPCQCLPTYASAKQFALKELMRWVSNAFSKSKMNVSTCLPLSKKLFPESCPYNVYRKDRNLHGGGVMLLVHKDISHIPITELENNSESVWVKVFANKTSHYVASWYRQPGGTSEDFQLFRDQPDHIRNQHKGKKLPSVHVLVDFNFRDINWPDRLKILGSALSQSEGQMLTDIMNDHGLEQLVHFPLEKKINWIYYSLLFPGQFQDIHSPDKLSDHDIVVGTLKVVIPPIKKPRRKVYLYQKGDYESMGKDAFDL